MRLSGALKLSYLRYSQPAAARWLPSRRPSRSRDLQLFGAPIGTRGYRQGWELARDEINGKGGVLGRKLEIIARDDAGKPDVAITQAVQLVDAEHVDLLTGTILSMWALR